MLLHLRRVGCAAAGILGFLIAQPGSEASVTVTIERLNPTVHGGPTPPSNLVVIDVMTDVSPTDRWITGGIAGVASGGATIVYKTVAGQPVLINPGAGDPFVTCLSRPMARTGSTRFTAGTATAVGAYSPAAPTVVATPQALNVAYSVLTPAPNGEDGAVARIVLSFGAYARADPNTVVVSTTPMPGWIKVFSSSGAGADLGTVSYTRDQLTPTGLNWSLWGRPSHMAADFNGDGVVNPDDLDDFVALFLDSMQHQYNGADLDFDGDTDCDDLAVFEWAFPPTPDPTFRVPLFSINGAWDGSMYPPLTVQNNQTSFGNNTAGAIDLANGSELDVVYGATICDRLYLLLAGNLKTDGTHLELFFDSIPGGQNRLRGNNANVDSDGLNRLGDAGTGNGLTFDSGFAADYYLTFSTAPTGSHDLRAWYATLPTGGGGTGADLGSTPAGTDGLSPFNSAGLRATINNSNTAGVPAGSGQSYGDGVTTGIELSLPLSSIGSPSCGFRVAAFITSPARDVVSNQVLGGLGGGFGSLGDPRAVNFASISRVQNFPGSTGFSNAAQIIAPDGAAGDVLKPVALSPTDLFAGAPENDPSGITGAGAVYNFEPVNNTWAFQQKITANDASSNDKFGTSVAYGGNILVVGSPQDDDRGSQSGSVYLYTRSAGVWTLFQKLTATDGSSNDNFGTSVAIFGTSVVVGAPGADGVQPGSGAAYVFEFQVSGLFAQVAKLAPTDGQTGDAFGTVVGVSGSYAIVGAEADDNSAGVDAGTVYIFRKSTTWGTTPSRVLQPAGLVPGAKFGRTVAIDGNYAAAGAPFTANGTAYVFKRSGFDWPLFSTLTAPDGGAGDAFGSAMAMKGDKLVIGASGDDSPHFNEGSAYLFQRSDSGWLLISKLLSPEGRAGDNFGGVGGAAVSGSLVTVSAGGADPNGNASQGAASLFTLGLSTPSILEHPGDVDLCAGGDAQFAMLAVSATPMTYSWRRNGVALTDGVTPQGSTLSGTTAPTLLVTGITAADAGDYDCRISNACGDTLTSIATLTVAADGCCESDYNQDGNADQDDVIFLIDVIASGNNPGGIDPDFNHDGNNDQDDISSLIDRVGGGPCP